MRESFVCAHLLNLAIGLLLSACTNGSTTVVASSDAAAPRASVEASSSSALRPGHSLAELFQLTSAQRWREAADWFDRFVSESQLTPKLRYLRSVIALELKDYESVVHWLSGLAPELPILMAEIRSARLEAEAQVLPTLEVAAELAKSVRAEDILSSVQAYRRLEEPLIALRVVSGELPGLTSRSPRSPSTLSLRRARAELLAELNRKTEAAAAYRQLALEEATSEAALGADLAYEKWGKVALTRAQRFSRAEAFSKSKQVERFEAEVLLMQSAPGQPVSAVTVKRSRAWAYYRSRKDYALAARLFFESSQADPSYRTQDLFYSARALSRAHQDEAAVERYLALANKYRQSPYAEQARFRAARLQQILGKFAEAKLGYLDYLKRYSSGRRRAKYAEEVSYELSLTRLALGEGKDAVAQLARLEKRAKGKREPVKLRHLLGVAYQQAKDVRRATELFKSVIEQRPLSLSALFSASRLKQLGQSPPPLMPDRRAEAAPSPLTIELPEKVELFLELGLHLAAERELTLQATRLAKKYAPNSGRALCQAFAQLNTAKARYRHGVRSVRERSVMRAIGPDTEWIWDCIYPQPYSNLVLEQQARYALPAGLILAVMRQESAFQSTVVSHAGAVGLMQLMPQTARNIASELGRQAPSEELTTPALNIEFGAFYLSKLLKRFSGTIPLAAAAYNAGPTAVARWLSGGKQLPLDLFVATIPYAETRGYVHRVVGNFARYRYRAGGLAAVPELSLSIPKAVEPRGKDY